MSELSYDAQANACEEQAEGDVQTGEMNAYELRQERRRERLAAAAARRRGEAESLIGRASEMADAIPFGQPILVGHHSEKRDRRFRARIDDKFRKGIETSRKAEELERRAESVGTGGISSDDPAAVKKLREELARLESRQEQMKIDIDKLTEAELIDLNRRIVERLRLFQQMHAHVEMLEFKVGERVRFQSGHRGWVEGMLTRYNRKTVTVITDDGHPWNVSPGFLHKIGDSACPKMKKAVPLKT